MSGRIELKKGWIIENHEGKYLSQNFLWVETKREKAYVHEGSPDDLMAIFEDLGSGAHNIYPAMVFNGHLLLGKPISGMSEEKLPSWN